MDEHDQQPDQKEQLKIRTLRILVILLAVHFVYAFPQYMVGARLSEDGGYVDAQAGSTWSLAGVATAGKLQGQLLHFNHFRFSWQAFYPDTKLHLAAEALS